MNFDELLKPYSEGGFKERPVKRTMGTITDYLINKKGYPLDIVGAAIFSIFFWLDAGNEFKGNGKYGSKGKELVTAIRMKCDELLYKRLDGEACKVFIEMYANELKNHITPHKSEWERKFSRWWRGRDESS